MRRVTLLHRFTISCAAALVIFGIVFGVVSNSMDERDMLTRANEITAGNIVKVVKNQFEPGDFIQPKTGLEYDNLTDRISKMPFGPGVERVKVWNRDKVVVWADDRDLVGKQFSDNEDLTDALIGRLVSELSRLDKTENASEFKFKRLLELYVPVQLGNRPEIDVVFEVYQNLDPLYQSISRDARVTWSTIGGGFILLFAILFGIVRAASRRMEQQSRDIVASEIKYRSLVESAQDAIISCTAGGAVILFNRAAEVVFGYSSDEIVGRTVMMLMPETHKAAHQAGMNRFRETGALTFSGETMQLEGMRKNGQIFPLELTLSVSGKGEGQLITGIVRDITERKAMQARLIEGERQATISLVAGGIGHELNNIVASLLGFSALLAKAPDDKLLAADSARVFGTESQRLKIHGRNLLALAKPQKPEMKPIAVNSLLDRVTDLLSASGILKSFTIVKEYADSLPYVAGDEMQLEQVIRNLEINAAHAMDGAGMLRISTQLSADESFIEFSISDTGHGIPKDKLEQSFVPFYTTKPEGQGTGLGLYIVKQVAEMHKGYIRVKSEVDKGTIMTVGLPVAKSD